MKTIIALTDFSDSAKSALFYAASLAKKFKAKLLVYHSCKVPALATDLPYDMMDYSEMMYEDKMKMQQTEEEIYNLFGVVIDPLIDDETVEERLPKLVHEEHADLVVVGMWGASTLEKKIFGSTAVSVMGLAHYPVLVVPEGVTFKDPQTILFACNFENIMQNNKLSMLTFIADTYHAEIDVVYVSKTANEMTGNNILEKLFSGIKHKYEVVHNDHVVRAISEKINITKPDMLALVPREHTYWDFILDKSISRKLAYAADIPLLILPNPLHR